MIQIIHRPLVPPPAGLIRDAEIAKKRIISGESGDTDSPEASLAFSQKPNFRERILFVCRYLPADKKIFSLRPQRLCGESRLSYIIIRKSG